MGVAPSDLILKAQVSKVKLKHFLSHTVLTFIFVLTFVYINSSSWLWIDKHSKALEGMVMPWSYIVITSQFYIHKNQENEKQILQPDDQILDDEK